MNNSICTISIGNLGLDEDYTFFTDGRVLKYYDSNYWKQNLEEYINVKDLSTNKKNKILSNCSNENLNIIKSILLLDKPLNK